MKLDSVPFRAGNYSFAVKTYRLSGLFWCHDAFFFPHRGFAAIAADWDRLRDPARPKVNAFEIRPQPIV